MGASRLFAVAVRVVDRNGGVVVQSLRHEVQRQRVAHIRLFLHLGALILPQGKCVEEVRILKHYLEPDFDLALIQLQLIG